MTTGGDLVFYGTPEGYLKAIDARNGKELWQFQTGPGGIAPPVTWEARTASSTVAVGPGWGGAVPLWGGDVALLVNMLEQGGLSPGVQAAQVLILPAGPGNAARPGAISSTKESPQ